MLRIFNAKSGTGIIRIYGVYSRTVIFTGMCYWSCIIADKRQDYGPVWRQNPYSYR